MRVQSNRLAASVDIPRRLALIALASAALLSMVAGRALGQHAGLPQATLDLSVHVGAQIRMHDGASARVTRHDARSVDIARAVSVGANVPFALTVRAGTLPAGVQAMVQNGDGAWVSLASGSAVTVGAGMRGHTTRELVYRLVSSSAAALDAAVLAVSVEAHSADAAYPALASVSSVMDTSALRVASR